MLRTALVTGAASGNGKAIAQRLAKDGMRVILVDLNGTAGEALCAQLTAEGRDVLFVKCNVADEAAVRALAGTVTAWTDHLDVLVNNAGIGRFGPIETFEVADWDLQMDVNVKAIYLVTRFIFPLVKAGAEQSIVNIGSGAGVVGVGNSIAYSASKGAVVAMSKSMAIDFAPLGIRVNCLCPGVVDTPFNQKIVAEAEDPESVLAAQRAVHPLGRLATAEDIADGVAFLTSSQASFITGTTFMVDGGLTAQ